MEQKGKNRVEIYYDKKIKVILENCFGQIMF